MTNVEQTTLVRGGRDIIGGTASPFYRALRWILRIADAAVDIVQPLLVSPRASHRWVLVENGDRIEIHRIAKDKTTAIAPSLAQLDEADPTIRKLAGAREVELRLDRGKTVSSRLLLPADARSYVDAIVAHRLDRLTPWGVSSVVYGTRILNGGSNEATIAVEFVATSREILAECLTPLRERSIAPSSIGVADGPLTEPVAVDLLGGQGGRHSIVGRPILRGLFLALLPVMLVAVLITGAVLSSVTAQLDGAMRDLSAQRARIVGDTIGVGGSDVQIARDMVETKQTDGARFAMISALAAAVPDHTFLTDLEISPATVRLRGSSLAAPSLVPALEALPMLQEVRFEAPLVREDGGRDRFDIIASRTVGEQGE